MGPTVSAYGPQTSDWIFTLLWAALAMFLLIGLIDFWHDRRTHENRPELEPVTIAIVILFSSIIFPWMLCMIFFHEP